MATTNYYRSRGHYNNLQKILVVGDGDFSFSNCLATSFVNAVNITATSLDSRDTVIGKYSHGENNLVSLEARGARVLHQVSVRTMSNHPKLMGQRFDRIVFNFPHSGDAHHRVREHQSCCIKRHRRVVRRFFQAARRMVKKGGEIHVTHKTTHPFDRWNIVELAGEAGLELSSEVEFDRSDYPGYVNKKGYGSRWDSTFPVGDSSTFCFK